MNCQVNIDDCEDNDCKNGAMCMDGIQTYMCLCQPGFSGDLCQTDVDECLSNACLNSALCIDLVNEFMCDCPAGYNGSLCEIDVDECASDPCPEWSYLHGCSQWILLLLCFWFRRHHLQRRNQ